VYHIQFAICPSRGGFWFLIHSFHLIFMLGWWGHDQSMRFAMPDKFSPIPGAQGFQQSKPSVLAVASLLGSLQVFESAGGMEPIRRKSIVLTTHLEALLKQSPYCSSTLPSPLSSSRETIAKTGSAAQSDSSGGGYSKPQFTIITPPDPAARGSQLSLLLHTYHRTSGNNENHQHPPGGVDGVTVKSV
jgi:kynureninase